MIRPPLALRHHLLRRRPARAPDAVLVDLDDPRVVGEVLVEQVVDQRRDAGVRDVDVAAAECSTQAASAAATWPASATSQRT